MRATPHGRLALSRRKFHATWGLVARDLARSDTDRRRAGERWVRPVGARPRRVADGLRMREACESERARRDPYLSGARLRLTVRKARVQMRAKSIHDVTSIKGTARKLPDVRFPLYSLSTERTTAAWGFLPTRAYVMLGMSFSFR